jgi:hypothetical protein
MRRRFQQLSSLENLLKYIDSVFDRESPDPSSHKGDISLQAQNAAASIEDNGSLVTFGLPRRECGAYW